MIGPHRISLGGSLWLLFAICLLASACSSPTRLSAIPPEAKAEAVVPGMPDIRYWTDEDMAAFTRAGISAFERELAHFRSAGNQGPLPQAELLAISGGGEDGAFGAGLLVGWTAAGTRPEFKVVTGISTGALTAPFAFLGPAYDEQLEEVYTSISAEDVLLRRSVLAAVLDDALADTAPLRSLIARHVDEALLDAIAAEHAAGRVLLIGTTNLDAQRPVIWDIGKIAASGHPDRVRLVQDILVASAAIPGAFPPVMIGVELEGRAYEEMHVDGGTSAQVFLYPPSFDLVAMSRQAGITRERRLFIIRNARLDPDWAEVRRRAMTIAGRAISSLIQTQGIGDLYRIYLTAQRDGIEFNLAYIPETFTTPLTRPFDTVYMQELFRLGYELGSQGYDWAKVPPGFTAPYLEPPVPPQEPAS